MSSNMFEIKDTNKYTGKGIFATEDIPNGKEIGVWITTEKHHTYRHLPQDKFPNKKWFEAYPLGRYCNHSENPNTYVNKSGNEIIISSADIEKGEEIVVDYNWGIDFIGFKSDLLK